MTVTSPWPELDVSVSGLGVDDVVDDAAVKLLHFRGPSGERNFGDELGPWLWERLLPDAFDDDPRELFVGIGTLLNNRLPAANRIVVFGAGVGYGDALPQIDASWSIHCVRGPLSAEALGLSRQTAITDPGALVRWFYPAADTRRAKYEFSFMPHWRFACDDWQAICARLGFGYIDPRLGVEEVIDQIRGTRVLLAEAMHGAIVADALRVPWVPVQSTEAILEFKWRDWCESLGLRYDPMPLVATRPLIRRKTLFRRGKHLARTIAAGIRLRSVARRAVPILSSESILSERVAALGHTLERVRAELPSRVRASATLG